MRSSSRVAVAALALVLAATSLASCGSAHHYGTLFTLRGGALRVLSAGDGHVVRPVVLPFKLGDLGGPMAVSADGRAVYVDTTDSLSCPADALLRIDLRTGIGDAAAQTGQDPAISPDGNRLAYLDDSSGRGCTEDEVTVDDLQRSDAVQTTRLPGPALASLAWMPDGSTLLIGTAPGTIEVYDTRRPISANNPRRIGVHRDHAYQSPVALADGRIATLAGSCDGACDRHSFHASAVKAIDPRTGHTTTLVTLRHASTKISRLVIDPSHRQLAGLTGTSLYLLIPHTTPRLVARNVRDAVWLPGSGQVRPPVTHITTLTDFELAPAAPGLTDHLVVPATGRAGVLLPAKLIVDNTTSMTIKLTNPEGCRPGYGVGLTARPGGLPSVAFALPCRFNDPLVLPPGSTVLTATIDTTTGSCAPPPDLDNDLPKCLPGDAGPPPLPPGRYQAQLAGSGGVPLPLPQAIPVTLTP